MAYALTRYIGWIFVAGSGMLGISIGLNAVSDHAVCTAVYVVVAFIVCVILGSIQTLGRISWIAWLGLFCILTSSKSSICFLIATIYIYNIFESNCGTSI